MSIVWCKELRGWCRSFTRTEALLSLLEGVLLVLFIAFLVFMILHFLACASKPLNVTTPTAATVTDTITTTTTTTQVTATTYSNGTTPQSTTAQSVTTSRTLAPKIKTTIARGKCTWEMSKKTTPLTRYYEQTNKVLKDVTATPDVLVYPDENSGYDTDYELDKPDDTAHTYTQDEDHTDGEDAEDTYKRMVLALVKMEPPSRVTFGCIVTIVSEYWVVTAASCIDAVEEVDALDSFVLAEGYGGPRLGPAHLVGAVRVHPRYGGPGRSHDLAALRSEDSLARAGSAAHLPTFIEYLLITIGQRLTLLGYGPFRTVDRGPLGRRLHKAYVYRLPARQCDVGAEAGALRHLVRGWPEARGPGGAGPLCGGVLHARGLPCAWCAGAPLLAAGGPGGPSLVGVMAGGAACGVSCEPSLYVNVAALLDWLHAVIQ